MLGPTILGEIDLLDLSNGGVSCTAQTAVLDNADTSGVRPEDRRLSLARRRPAGGLCECRRGHKRPPVEIPAFRATSPKRPLHPRFMP